MIYCLVMLIAARLFDLWTTYQVTPDLSRELNPIYRWAGWRWVIVMNLLLCPLSLILPEWWTTWVCLLSLIVGAWNLLNRELSK